MDKKEKAKETVQPEITVEQLQTENGTLKDRITELEKTSEQTVSDRDTLLTENVGLKQQVRDLEDKGKVLSEDLADAKAVFNENEVLKQEVADLKTKITELSSEENDSSTLRKVDKEGNIKIKILLSPAGKFLLPYNVGQVVSHPANQADEMVELKYAEYVK